MSPEEHGAGGADGRARPAGSADSSGVGTGRVLPVLFGDRRGLALFLAAIVVLGSLWRVGFFIADSVAIANTLFNVAAGTLEVRESPFSLTVGTQPGLHIVDGRLYGRNYGQVLVATPILLALRGVAAIAEPRLVVLGCWSLAGLGLGRVLGDILDSRRLRYATTGIVAVVFGIGVLGGTTLPSRDLPIVALQLVTLLAVGVTTVAVYRVVRLVHGWRVGTAAGAGVLLATPLSFWATIPKRHTITAAAIAVSIYWFALSRTPGPRSTAARAGVYVILGLFATVHAFEAAVLVAVLVPIDLLTAPRNDHRTIAAVGVAFTLSLLPLAVVNALISGNPLKPPRLLESVDVGVDPPAFGGDPGGGGGDGSGGGTGSGGGPLATVLALGGDVLRIPRYLLDSAIAGVGALTEPGRLWHVFVRSGHIPGVEYAKTSYEAVELTVLESFPLLGALAWLPVAGFRRIRRGTRTAGAATATDLLVGGWIVVFVLVYLPLLPLHSQITARYLTPLAPLGIYAVARLVPIRSAIETAPRTLGVGFAASTTVLSLGLVLAIHVLDLAVGEAVQLHGLLGLLAGTSLALVTAAWRSHRDERAVLLGLLVAAGLGASFLILSAFVYFRYGGSVLDPARILAALLPSL